MASGDDRASFAIELRDETSAPAKDAASALEALKAKIKADTAALREMQAAMRAMKGATGGGALKAMKDLKDKIDAQKASIAAAQAKYLQLGGTFGTVAQRTHAASSGFDGLLGRLTGLPGPLGALGSRLSSLASLSTAAAGMIALVVSALAAFAAATARATAQLFRYGIAQSNARRAELGRLEGLTTLRRWYGLTAGSATEMQAAIDRVNEATAVGRGQLEQYTAQLHRMGLRGDNLTQALEGMAIVGAVQGEAMARRFAGMAAGANRAGHSVRALADDVRARLGGVAARRMLDLDVQMRRFHDSLGRIFGDLRIEGFLRALNEMTSMFSQSTATGRALKAIVETIFNPVLDAAGSGAPLVRRFFQGMVVGALLVTIGVIRLARLLQSVFGGSEILRGINAQRIAFGLGAAVVGAFVFTLAAAAAVAGLVVAAVGAITATVAAASAGILAGVAALAGLVAAGIRAVQWFRSTDFSSLGRSIVDGLIRGIQVGALRIPASMQNLAAQARGALEQALRMRSPSRVFAELGAQIPAGLAVGVERGAGAAQDAVDGMVGTPTLAAGGSTTHVSIEGGIHVHAQSGDQAREIAESIHEQLAAVLEGLGASIGSSVPA